MLTVVLVFSGRVVAQNTCSQPIGGCNYEVDTTGTPGSVGVHAVIVNTMTVQSYGPNDDG
ncbi:hypothetical protein [Vulcanisaeta sp. JCM 16159]|uniref:hypothetical protein n=1 Tax=Vulcanisaeta sp. JCM 16159 TaxID=1295371 RepID=UPI000AA2C012|nr:hypothetical protein [Vulcanisaeta sp. JCM 16159]